MKPVQLGKSLDETDLDRDAIHIAVLKTVSDEDLFAGMHVRLAANGVAKKCDSNASIGVVDPFFEGGFVEVGEKFYILLKPYTITGLCHIWTHPEVPDMEQQKAPEGSGTRADGSLVSENEKQKAEAELWLREFAEECSISFNTLMETLEGSNEDEDYTYTFRGIDTPPYVNGREEALWENWKTLTGNEVRDKNNSPFSCAC